MKPVIRHDHGDFDYDHDPNWRIFRIMAEFVDGFDFIAKFERSVTFFGSARATPQDTYYDAARSLATRLGGDGWSTITGGGPGIMEAANEGAKAAGADSVGLNIQLPTEQRINPYVTRSIGLEHFYTRKVMLSFAANAYVFFPGGFGTLDEVFEMLTLIQTKKITDQIPVVLFGTDYWSGLVTWLTETVLKRYKAIDEADLTLWTLTDDVEEAFQALRTGKERSVRL